VTRLADKENTHVGLATLFKSDFKRGQHEVGGGYALIEQFVQTFPICLEVIFS
jgi:hypothetical protein